MGITDGDTIKAVINGVEIKIRLYGIDAPEKAQPFGQVASDALKQATTGHAVTVQAIDQDRYGRTVALVFADGVSVNEAMVKSGNAWVYNQYCKLPTCREWARLQATAKSAKVGLWRDATPIPPWEWRHGEPQRTSSPEKQVATILHGNVNSKKFHSSGCRQYDCSNCTAKFATREQAVAAGYTPCKICSP